MTRVDGLGSNRAIPRDAAPAPRFNPPHYALRLLPHRIATTPLSVFATLPLESASVEPFMLALNGNIRKAYQGNPPQAMDIRLGNLMIRWRGGQVCTIHQWHGATAADRVEVVRTSHANVVSIYRGAAHNLSNGPGAFVPAGLQMLKEVTLRSFEHGAYVATPPT
jgi:hypothetical protein